MHCSPLAIFLLVHSRRLNSNDSHFVVCSSFVKRARCLKIHQNGRGSETGALWSGRFLIFLFFFFFSKGRGRGWKATCDMCTRQTILRWRCWKNSYVYVFCRPTLREKQGKFSCTVHRILMLLIFQLVCIAIPNMFSHFWECVCVYLKCVYMNLCVQSSKSVPNLACAMYPNDIVTARNSCCG